MITHRIKKTHISEVSQQGSLPIMSTLNTFHFCSKSLGEDEELEESAPPPPPTRGGRLPGQPVIPTRPPPTTPTSNISPSLSTKRPLPAPQPSG